MTWWQEIEPPNEEQARIAKALAPWCTERIALLRQVRMSAEDEGLLGALALQDPATLDQRRRHWIRQMLYRYRRALPPDARPKVNPDDPIVREMEEAGV